jgi:LacI family transcriptional regulator
MSRKRPPTMSDIAKLAGVSRTTVSFVLNNVNDNGIPEETKEKVRTAARELGYRPNVAARLLRMNRSQTIGFITDEIASTPFAGNIIKGAQDAAWANDKVLMIINTNNNPKIKEQAVEMMLERRVEGIVYAAWYHQAVDPLLASGEAPLVLVDCYSEDRSLPSVVPDEVSGGRTATEALIRRGHERIGFINLRPGIPATIGRLKGYKQALAAHDLAFDESLVLYHDGTVGGGYRLAAELLRRPDRPTAIFCGNDRLAMDAYDAIKELGLRIPDDIAVVGFDNQEIIAARLRPPLSTVALPHYEMGQWAVNHLIEHAEGGEIAPVQHTIDCPYVERESI